MLRIDKGRRASGLLCFGDHLQREGCLAGRLWPVNLDNPATWQAANPQRHIQPQ